MLTTSKLIGEPHTYAELRAALGRPALDRVLAEGRLVRLWGVLVPRDQILDPLTRASAALLTLGGSAVLTGLTAAWLHGCAAAETASVHVAVPYSRGPRKRDGLVVHHGRRLLEEITEVRGLRCVPLDVAVTEVLCSDLARRALAVADQAAAQYAEADRAAFRARIAERLAARADRRGTVRAARLLPLVTGRAESPPESWLKLLVVEAGFPQPVDQFAVVDAAGVVRYILDLCWPELRIALEYDGYEAHEHRADRDAQRDLDLRRRGWCTIRVTADDLRDPSRLLARLDEEFRTRGVIVSERGHWAGDRRRAGIARRRRRPVHTGTAGW